MKQAQSATKIKDINGAGNWVSLEVVVTDVQQPDSDSVSQVGILNDETGHIRFVCWMDASLPTLEEGKTYQVEQAVVEDWQDQFRLNLNQKTDVSEIDRDIHPASSFPVRTIENVLSDEMVVERCPDCRRVLVNDHCPVHLDVDAEPDLRAKTRIASGEIVIFGGDHLRKITGLSIEEAHRNDEEEVRTTIKQSLEGTEVQMSLFPISEEKNIFGVENLFQQE
jgi:replication factor A1